MAEVEQKAQERMEAALRPFGWTMGGEFWRRYYTDPWVFNLANAVQRLSEQLKGVCPGAPNCTCTNGIGCVRVPVEEW